jgi:hypothetical protein
MASSIADDGFEALLGPSQHGFCTAKTASLLSRIKQPEVVRFSFPICC